MAKKEQNQERRGTIKNLPTLASTYIKTMLGIDAWDISISQEQLEAKVLQAININPDLAKNFQVVSYTMDPEIQQRIQGLQQQQKQVEKRIEGRRERHEQWKEKTFLGKTPEELNKKEMEKWDTEAERVSTLENRDQNTLTKLAKAEKDLRYPEEIKQRNVQLTNEKNQRDAEKLIDTIAGAEEKKEKLKRKQKAGAIKFIGGQIVEGISGAGEGFQQGRHLRGY